MPERVPYEEGYFTMPDAGPPQLCGTRCRRCSERFYPRRHACARCCETDVEDVLLSNRGTLYSYTILRATSFGDSTTGANGYAAGQIDLPEGPRVQSVLLGDPGTFRIGMAMEMVLEPAGTDREGRELMMYRFRPAA
jgi:uncharacterized OB-fold protein